MTRVASLEIPSTISGFISAIWRASAFKSLLAYAWRQPHCRFSPASPWNLQPSLSTRPANDQNMVDHQEHDGGLLLLVLLSCVAGAATGLVVAMFRIALQHADHWRDAWIARAYVHGLAGSLLTVAAIAALTGLAARLVSKEPASP